MLAAAVVYAGCGGSGKSVCGNGRTEPGEECDSGAMNGQPGNGCSASCTLVNIVHTSLEVTWKINAMAAPMFSDESCFTVGDTGYRVRARVTLAGPAQRSDDFDCAQSQNMYLDDAQTPLPPGDYTVTARLFERADDGMTMDLTDDVSGQVTVVAQQSAQTTVNFTVDHFRRSYSGELFFQTSAWNAGSQGGGAVLTSCRDAGVEQVRFYLRKDGQPVSPAPATTDGIPLDGSREVECHTPAGPTDAYQVSAMTWGLYDLVVAGYNDMGELRYCSASPVFVGAGGANPTYGLTTWAGDMAGCP
jgi:cysteine-rich repeat protein